MEEPLDEALVSLIFFGGVRFSGNHQGEIISVSQVKGDSDMVSACICTAQQDGLNKETMASTSTSFWEKAAPSALNPKPDNYVPPHISLAPLSLLPKCWSSEQVSLSVNKSVSGSLRRNVCASSYPLSHSAAISTVFHSQKLWRTPLTGTEILGLGALYGVWTLCSSSVISAFETSISILNCHMCV